MAADSDSFIGQKIQLDIFRSIFRSRESFCVYLEVKSNKPISAVSNYNGETILLQAWFSHGALFHKRKILPPGGSEAPYSLRIFNLQKLPHGKTRPEAKSSSIVNYYEARTGLKRGKPVQPEKLPPASLRTYR